MSSSWNHKPVYDPAIGEGYISCIEQIWVEIYHAAMSVIPENNLVDIVLGYAKIDDFCVFLQVLAIHVPRIATLASWTRDVNIYLGSRKSGFPGYSMSRMGFIHVVATNGMWHLKATDKRFDIVLREMFQHIQARDYIGIAKYMKHMLYKSYRPNLDKLSEVAKTCADVMESHAKFMLRRFAMKKLKKEDILPEIDPGENTRFWSIFTKKRTYLDVFEKSE